MDAKNQRTSLITFLLVLALFVVVTAKMIAPYVIAIIKGANLVLLSKTAYDRLVGRGLKPKLSSSIVTITVILLVVAPLIAFTTVAVKQAVALTKWATDSSGLNVQDVLSKVSSFGPVSFIIGDSAELEAQLHEWAQTAGAGLTTFVVELAKSVPDAVLQLFLACLTCFFFLLDGRAFVNWFYNKIPLETDIRNKLSDSFKDTAISTIWASMAAAATQAVVMMIAFGALGVPAATLAGGATFIFAWIPILGSTPVWIAGCMYLFTQGATGKVIAMLVFGIFTGIIDNFVRPWVLKGRGEMHPLVSLVAIFGGIQMFGLFGVFLGPILAAIVITLLQVWPIVGRRSGLSIHGAVEVPRPDDQLV